MKKTILATALLTSIFASSAIAVESPKWDNASISYNSVDVDGDKLTGFGFSATKLLGESFFVTGAIANADDSEEFYGDTFKITYDTLTLGLGYRHSATEKTDIYGLATFEDAEVELSFNDEAEAFSDDGYGLTVGVRSMVSDSLELGAAIKYIDIADDSDTPISLSAKYYMTDNFVVGVSYVMADETDTTSLSISYFF